MGMGFGERVAKSFRFATLSAMTRVANEGCAVFNGLLRRLLRFAMKRVLNGDGVGWAVLLHKHWQLARALSPIFLSASNYGVR